jgi:hypothetical protein
MHRFFCLVADSAALIRPSKLNCSDASLVKAAPVNAPPSAKAETDAKIQLHSNKVAKALVDSVRLLAAVKQAKQPSWCVFDPF